MILFKVKSTFTGNKTFPYLPSINQNQEFHDGRLSVEIFVLNNKILASNGNSYQQNNIVVKTWIFRWVFISFPIAAFWIKNHIYLSKSVQKLQSNLYEQCWTLLNPTQGVPKGDFFVVLGILVK